MHRPSQPARLDGRRIGLLVLGACTVWLVIQNTLLFVAMMWGDPSVLGRIAMTVIKAGALVTAKFWASPAAAALVAAVVLLLVMRARPAASTRTEVRHG
jgi:hypothetical protein